MKGIRNITYLCSLILGTYRKVCLELHFLTLILSDAEVRESECDVGDRWIHVLELNADGEQDHAHGHCLPQTHNHERCRQF